MTNTREYDNRTEVHYLKKTIDGKNVVVIDEDEYCNLSERHRAIQNKLYRFEITHSIAHDATKIMVILRIVLGALLGLLLPVLFSNPGMEFDMFYGMLFLALLFSLFIPDNEVDCSELASHFMTKR